MVFYKTKNLIRESISIDNRKFFLSPKETADSFRKKIQETLYQHQRDKAERILDQFSRMSQSKFEGHVLVDAQWDNPNYWIRYALLRSALGLVSGYEVGLLGKYRTKFCQRSLKHFGIQETINILDCFPQQELSKKQAEQLLERTRSPEDILEWNLPDGLPADFIYDGILKRQRTACVDLSDPNLLDYVTEALSCIAAARKVLADRQFDLLILSHVINFNYAALAWCALNKKIPIILMFGNYGHAKFVKIERPSDMYEWVDRPIPRDLESILPEQQRLLKESGWNYLERRLSGQTNDIGAVYAFQKRKDNIERQIAVEQFGWHPNLPIIAVYASNWFDFPHCMGMSYFRDFLDWIQATVEVALLNRNVNWLFKGHPCDEWYDTKFTLRELLSEIADLPHIQIVPDEWNGLALMNCVDGLVTYHGTAGIEYAAMGKPVLVSDRGWYHDLGFAKFPHSRDEYLNTLNSEWWQDIDTEKASHFARMFAGFIFCRPQWQQNFVLQDDSVQDPIYSTIPQLFRDYQEEISLEQETLKAWFESSERFYHTFKMKKARDFSV